MNSSEQRLSHRNIRINCPAASTRSPARAIGYAALCLYVLFFAGPAFGQTAYYSHLADAVSAQSAGNLPAAITAYQDALAIRKDIPEVWANLGLMQHQTGDYAAALRSFETAHRLQPKLFVPLLFLGVENLHLGNKLEAVRYLSMARQLHPNDPEIYMNLGRAYFGLRKFENASDAYRRATNLDTRNGDAWYRLGITYLEMSEAASGDFAKLNRQSPFFQRLNAESLSDQDRLADAEEAFRTLIAGHIFPSCTRSSFGMVLLRRGKSSEASSQFEQDLKSGGCSPATIGLARLALEKGDFDSVSKSIASLWTLDSGFVRAHASELTRGTAQEQIEMFDHALAQPGIPNLSAEATSVLQLSLRGERTLSVQSDLSDNPAPARPSALRSTQEYFAQGEYGKCVKNLIPEINYLSSQNLSLLAACSFFNGNFRTTLAAANKLRSSTRTEEEGLYWAILAEQRLALLALSYAGEVEPNSIRLHELLAESYRDREKYADAEAEYKVALKINPKEFAALVGAATNYLQELRIDLAHEMIQNALTLNPSDAEANYIMGEVLFAEHKYPEAEPHLKAGLTARAELIPRIHALLGQVYATRGDTKLAIEEYKLGLPSDDDGSVHFQLGRLYQKSGEANLAADAFSNSRAINLRRQEATRNAFGHQQGGHIPRPE